jgi:MoaA/NifB/PqqE/SkfB family radical SAM enzyme
VDLAFPCNLACAGCARGRQRGLPDGAGARAIAERLAVAVAAEPVVVVSAVFYGGEPLLDADALCAGVSAVRDACAAAGRGLEATVVTNGLLLDAGTARRLAHAGVGTVQVGLRTTESGGPGPRQVAEVIGNARAARAALDVLVRVQVDGPGELEAALELVKLLDQAGVLAPPRPAAVLLGARASYASQARALLAAPALLLAALAARRRFGPPQGPPLRPVSR